MISLRPVTIRQGMDFVKLHHRHLPKVVGGLFAVGVECQGELVGCAIVSRPVARLLADGYTAEVSRVAVQPDIKNGCSMLYGACRRAAKALGYRRLYTYTLEVEPGVSLRASGWAHDGVTPGREWSVPSRPRPPSLVGPKNRWRIDL